MYIMESMNGIATVDTVKDLLRNGCKDPFEMNNIYDFLMRLSLECTRSRRRSSSAASEF